MRVYNHFDRLEHAHVANVRLLLKVKSRYRSGNIAKWFRMPLEDNTASWFLAQLKPNSHRIAARNLQRQGFKTFLPMHERIKNSHGKFQAALEPLFPGYIFVAVDIARGGWRSINATFGVTRMVSFGTVPAMVPCGLVSQLMQRFDEEGKPRTTKGLEAGDRIRLISGPFSDFVTNIESIDAEKRVWVLIDLLGRPTRVAVDVAILRPAEAP